MNTSQTDSPAGARAPISITIELRRVGRLSKNRQSSRAIPIEACMLQGSHRGTNLLKSPMTDVESAKATVQFLLEQQYQSAVSITWKDLTSEAVS